MFDQEKQNFVSVREWEKFTLNHDLGCLNQVSMIKHVVHFG